MPGRDVDGAAETGGGARVGVSGGGGAEAGMREVRQRDDGASGRGMEGVVMMMMIFEWGRGRLKAMQPADIVRRR